MALNIVHAVEFSRNGRTRVSASRPALRATYLSYHFPSRTRSEQGDPATVKAVGRHNANVGFREEVEFHLRLEITESQCDFEAIWLRISPTGRAAFRFPHRRGDE